MKPDREDFDAKAEGLPPKVMATREHPKIVERPTLKIVASSAAVTMTSRRWVCCSDTFSMLAPG